MSSGQDHLDPKEATEAKLCAYLEGELAPEDRAEIERHLAANPQHRQLLTDLAKTREWIRLIPREISPIDLAEAFQGQVERSMLLDGTAGRSSAMSGIRWPQFLMVAAIVLLTLGLGVTIVAMLSGPRGHKQASSQRPFSTALTPAATQPELKNRASGTDDQSGSIRALAAKPAVVVAPLASESAAPKAVAQPRMFDGARGGGGGGFGGGGGGGGFGGSSASPATVPAAMALADADRPKAIDHLGMPTLPAPSDADTIKGRLINAGYHLPLDQKTVCFVVSADSPAAADEWMRGFFARHELLMDQNTKDKQITLADAAISQGNNSSKLPGGVMNNINPLPAAPSQNQNSSQLKQADNQTVNSSNGTINNGQFSAGLQSTTAPASEHIYVARGVSMLQVNLLSASLATDNLNQTVKRLTLSDGSDSKPAADRAATTRPAGTIQPGQKLSVMVAELQGPGVDKKNEVKVEEDGSIRMPMIDPLPAAGATANELEKRIADKYRDANLIPAATVSVGVAQGTTQPASQPITMVRAGGLTMTTQPGVAEATPPLAATVPAAEESKFDLVVVIEKSNSPAAP